MLWDSIRVACNSASSLQRGVARRGVAWRGVAWPRGVAWRPAGRDRTVQSCVLIFPCGFCFFEGQRDRREARRELTLPIRYPARLAPRRATPP